MNYPPPPASPLPLPLIDLTSLLLLSLLFLLTDTHPYRPSYRSDDGALSMVEILRENSTVEPLLFCDTRMLDQVKLKVYRHDTFEPSKLTIASWLHFQHAWKSKGVLEPVSQGCYQTGRGCGQSIWTFCACKSLLDPTRPRQHHVLPCHC